MQKQADFNEYNYLNSKGFIIIYSNPMILYKLYYIFILKSIITKNWPQGIVSHLILWYSTVSVAVVFLLVHIKRKQMGK